MFLACDVEEFQRIDARIGSRSLTTSCLRCRRVFPFASVSHMSTSATIICATFHPW